MVLGKLGAGGVGVEDGGVFSYIEFVHLNLPKRAGFFLVLLLTVLAVYGVWVPGCWVWEARVGPF